jgi:hypothetical protein
MTAADISSSATCYDGLPSIGMSLKIVTVTCTEDDDWVDMSNWGFKTLYMAIALVANASEACTISGTTVVFTAGATDAITVLVIGV